MSDVSQFPEVAALPPEVDTSRPHGSYLVASHVTAEHNPAGSAAGQRAYRGGGVPMRPRDSDVFARVAFGGMQLVEPGVVLVSEWRRPDSGPVPPANEVNAYCGVARKP